MTNTSLFWAFAIVWILHVGYLLSIAVRQNSLLREIATLKAMLEQKQASEKTARPAPSA